MIVSTEHLSKRYGRVQVLDDVNLQIPEGSAFALVGTNGAGKTTTMRILVNIIQPSYGAASVLGTNSRLLAPQQFMDIGYISENQVLPERLSIAQYFDYLRALYPKWDRGFEQSLRRKMELPPDRSLANLSHGMRMKTVLIAGLAFRPKLLILDEPLSGMDTLTRDEVVEGLIEQADETTILISSHELSEIENFTSHIAFMDKGVLYFQESIESLNTRFREVHVTLSDEKQIPADFPDHWLLPEVSGHSLHFFDSKFEGVDKLNQQLSQRFGAIQVEEDSMSLREISKVLIKEKRNMNLEQVA